MDLLSHNTQGISCVKFNSFTSLAEVVTCSKYKTLTEADQTPAISMWWKNIHRTGQISESPKTCKRNSCRWCVSSLLLVPHFLSQLWLPAYKCSTVLLYFATFCSVPLIFHEDIARLVGNHINVYLLHIKK